jgi:hypothetical protein
MYSLKRVSSEILGELEGVTEGWLVGTTEGDIVGG